MARGWLGMGGAVIVAALVFGCSSGAEPEPKGESCYRAQDCREGLVCVNAVCSDNVESLVSTLPPPGAPAPAVSGARR